MVNLLVDLSDYGPTFLVTARCGPACRVVWEGGGRNPFLSLLGLLFSSLFLKFIFLNLQLFQSVPETRYLLADLAKLCFLLASR
jgi:hypothetical protein